MRILVADDEESLRDVVSQVLQEDGHEVTTAESGEAAFEEFLKKPFPLLITDIRMGGMDGLELLKKVKDLHPGSQVVIMTSHASLDSAISAMQSGAYDYLIKPFEDLDLISTVAARAIEKIRLIDENRELVKTLKKNNEELERMNNILSDLALRDGLTGLFNHRYFQEALAKELTRSRRHARAVSLIFMDVDYFKKYNDTHGHQEGDKLLLALAKLMKNRLRATDIVARYGGEEFVAILPETIKINAVKVAEELRDVIAGNSFPGGESQPLGRLTVSIGVTGFPDDGDDGATLIQLADKALYRAKQKGRNAVCVG